MTARKIRSDSTVKSAEWSLGLNDSIKNPGGTNARDKKIGTLRKEYAKKGKKKEEVCNGPASNQPHHLRWLGSSF